MIHLLSIFFTKSIELSTKLSLFYNISSYFFLFIAPPEVASKKVFNAFHAINFFAIDYILDIGTII